MAAATATVHAQWVEEQLPTTTVIKQTNGFDALGRRDPQRLAGTAPPRGQIHPRAPLHARVRPKTSLSQSPGGGARHKVDTQLHRGAEDMQRRAAHK